MGQFLGDWQTWLWPIGILVGVAILALLGHYILFLVVERIAKRTESIIDDLLVRYSRQPARAIFPLLAVLLVLPILRIPAVVMEPIRHAIGLGLIASGAWLAMGTMGVFEDLIASKYRIDVQDNLAARRVRTQIQVLRRIAVVIVGVVTLSIMLMTFPTIRQLGAGLFASAGLVGLVVGFAARPALSNLIAGVQIALTEPIRLDDVVIVAGEWGWIEEIGTTYVVVRIWDLRRLVMPLSYFIERPFQNWTRATADILGTVFVYADYTVPVEEVRQELHRILKSSGMWDGKVWNLQVTNATEHTMEMRALMSAPDSGKAWDLRCYVREKLVQYLQERYPQSLPRARAEIQGTPVS